MDGARFDDLARAVFAGRSSRRSVLRRLTGGSLIAGIGGVAVTLKEAAARRIGTEAFDLECRQTGVRFFCSGTGPATTCKGGDCICAQSRQSGAKNVCIQSPATGCPRRRDACRRHSQCAAGQVCVRVSSCCENNPERGKCVTRCSA